VLKHSIEMGLSILSGAWSSLTLKEIFKGRKLCSVLVKK
jgi:DNA-binding HxlR family transcriptional regulator